MSLRALFSLLLLAVVALGLGWVLARNRSLAEASRQHDVAAWLRVQFDLDAAALEKINQLQVRFESACADHCQAIAEARSALKSADTEANRIQLQAALKRCDEARREHVRALAACMPEEKGRAYLEMVLPRIAAAEHDGAPDAAGHSR